MQTVTGAAQGTFAALLEPPQESLECLVGPQRAAILRLLDARTSCGEIAEALLLAPGGVTHHLRSLEAAGLVRRTRRGRHIFVERTGRGTALLALYQCAVAPTHEPAPRPA